MNDILTNQEILRYGRQLVLPELGIDGQIKLKQASALLVGVGGLGSVQALYLAAAGIGRIGLVDGDLVDISNLQRQILYEQADQGQSKVHAAEKKLRALNPEIRIDVFDQFLEADNAGDLINKYDCIIDGSDNFSTRYLINDVAHFNQKPVISGSVFRFEGQVTVFDSRTGPCYRCLYPEPPQAGIAANCITGGILGVVPGMIGIIQATEAIRCVLGFGSGLSGKLMLVNTFNWDIQTIGIEKNENCPLCGKQPSITGPIDYEDFCHEAVVELPEEMNLSPGELQKLIIQKKAFNLLDIRELPETRICRLEKAYRVSENQLPDYMAKLKKDDPIILYCRSGVRSARAAHYLARHGFHNVRHLSGGILAWIEQIDPSMPAY